MKNKPLLIEQLYEIELVYKLRKSTKALSEKLNQNHYLSMANNTIDINSADYCDFWVKNFMEVESNVYPSDRGWHLKEFTDTPLSPRSFKQIHPI